jgi:integrase/recombinase XerC
LGHLQAGPVAGLLSVLGRGPREGRFPPPTSSPRIGDHNRKSLTDEPARPLPFPAPWLSVLVLAAGERARTRFWEFFAGNIRNKHTRRAYALAIREFLAWCESAGVASIADVRPLHVAAYIEQLGRERSTPTAKQRLAAIRHLFDWLVTGQVMPANPASSVRGPSHSVKRGKTPVFDPSEARALRDAIDVSTPVNLRDRALIGLMVYSFARIGAALAMNVEDVYVQNRRL